MAIRERFRRAMRKSEASDVISQTSSNTTVSTQSTANTSQSSENELPLKKTSSKLFNFGSRDKEKTKSKNKRLHPSEKPLTAQNLRHQELLSQFTMTFGASNPNQIESQSFIGVSPCCTRPTSRRPSVSLDLAPDDSTSFSVSTTALSS